MKHPVIKYFLISIVIIIVDQIVKMLVHHNMQMGSQGQILILGDLFKFHYLTNPGMAFGMRLDFEYGKLMLTIFRIGAMFAIGYYLCSLVKKEANRGLLICISLILGGGSGNLIKAICYVIRVENAQFDVST
ncbi:MAG: signal peptidase II, partial [Ekhidna sp.]|nr:signal peptidase II [Ekhidna sp.]